MAQKILNNESIDYPMVPAREILEKYATVNILDWSKIEGECRRKENGEYVVNISRGLCGFSYGWPYAHELGHIVLGHCQYGAGKLTARQEEIYKREANHFAAEFLMPEKWMRECWEQTKINTFRDLRSYVQGFGVSWYAMELRLQELELCSRAHLKQL